MADDPFVVNASPLIVLAKIGRLALLDKLGTVMIPDAVVDEVVAAPAGDPARTALEAGFGRRVSVADVPDRVIEWSLGAGESSVIAVCLERGGATAVLDDAEARACARTLAVPVIGTLGVIGRARTRGWITSAASVIRELRDAGLYVDDDLVESILRGLGEP